MKVLCIDDEQLFLLTAKKTLDKKGYQVRTAKSIEEGILKFNSFTPDIVLLDMNMPERSGNKLETSTGLEVVKYIRTFLRKLTPIIVVSGNTELSVMLKNFELGINEYLYKPLRPSDLLSSIVKVSSGASSF